MKLLVLFLTVLVSAQAQTIEAVVNVGDWSPRITLGSLVAVFGEKLSTRQCVASTTPLPNDLCGVEVIVVDAVGSYLAPVFYVSPGQVNFYFPAAQIFKGRDPLRKEQSTRVNTMVCVGDETSFFTEADLGGPCKLVDLNVAPEPALLEWYTSDGLARPVITHADGRLVTRELPVEWEETLVVYTVGLGVFGANGESPVAGLPNDGFPAPLDRLVHLLDVRVDQVESEIAGIPVSGRYTLPVFTGLAPGFIGLGQINFTVSRLLSNSPEPRIIIRSSLFGTESKAYTIPMSAAAQASWRR
jgi:uncharacterized protein (TIGR03437 family)